MTRRERIAFVVCVLVHAYVLWNVYQADQLTPRIINLPAKCARPTYT